ncbi:unnamed protein product [Lymnaea stagnalis]|uniref:CABIT domain-containing protein n=1 Tax=Lymnaea stagnalis TaxID=6523 RepID=A0AAV2IFH0_LYMST
MATPDPMANPAPHSPVPDWGTDAVPLRDFASKRPVPGFAKVVKGNYMTLGANKFSFQRQYQEVFLHSIKVGVKVLAHCLRRVDATTISRRGNHNIYMATKLYAVDQRLAIPISYQGWFELLSEDGKSARPIGSVHELSKVRPDRCLVRENIKAYLMSEDERCTFDKTKIVIAGDQLVLNGELELPSPGENKKVKLLRCFDSKGEIIYLSFDQKGTFTPIAGENDFTGVFQIRDIVRRFRLPLTVKLVQGVRPKVDPSRFTGVIRLDWVYTDETAFVCPVDKNLVRLLPVPIDVNLQLVAASNQQAMKSSELYRTMITKCNRMIANYNNTLHLIVQVPEAAAKGKGRPNTNVFSVPLQAASTPSLRSRSREHLLMDEIDDLYAYVRDGGPAPIKTKFTYDSDEESYWEEPAYEPLDEFRARLMAIEAGERVSYHAKYQPQDPSKLRFDMEADFRKSNDNLLEGSNGSPKGVLHQNKGLPPPAVPKGVPPPLPPRPPDLFPTQSSSPASSETARDNETTLRDKETTSRDNETTPRDHETTPSSTTSNGHTSQVELRVTTVSNLGLVSSNRSSSVTAAKAAPKESKASRFFKHSKSNVETNARRDRLQPTKTGSQESNSTSGSSGNGHHIARDFKDSDISSMTKAGSSGSSGGPASNLKKRMQTLYL